MIKDFSIENWILGGTAFVLIFTIGCFVWFQFQMSTIEIYDSNQEEVTQPIDETSDTDHQEIQHIEIYDTEDNDTTGKNSTDTESIDDESSEVTSTQQRYFESVEVNAHAHPKQVSHNTKMRIISQNI